MTTTVYIVQPFEVTAAGRIVGRPAMQVQSAQHARRRAEVEARRHGGAIAFSRTGDMSSGDFDDAVVLGQFGLVPEEV